MKAITKVGGVLIVFMALVLLVGTTWTFAQDDPTPDTVTPDSETDDSADTTDLNGRFGKHNRFASFIDRDAAQEALADSLGLTVDELAAMRADGMSMTEILEAQDVTEEEVQAAMQAFIADAVETAVADGTLTEEQAAQILERSAESGFKLFGGGRRGHRFGSFGLDGEAQLAAIADVLGITTEELDAYRADGLKLDEIVAELDLDLETVQADLSAAKQAARAEALQQAVEDGTLTQEQADQLLEMEGNGRGFGGPRGHGGPRGFGGQFDGGFAPDTAPTLDGDSA